MFVYLEHERRHVSARGLDDEARRQRPQRVAHGDSTQDLAKDPPARLVVALGHVGCIGVRALRGFRGV